MGDTGGAGLSAVSVDGRTFTFGGQAATPLVPGDLVLVEVTDQEPLLGQVLQAGEGQLVGRLLADGTVAGAGGRRPFADAPLRPAAPEHLMAVQRSRAAELTIGSWSSAGSEVPARLRTQGFARHTFLCGQSGSGKTYALGVLLEQLLLGTALRMVVLDPNADFVRLGQPRPDADDDAVRRLEQMGPVRVLGTDPRLSEPLRTRFTSLPRNAQAAVLQLDPIADRGEYNQFLHLVDDAGPQDVDEVVKHLQAGDADERSLAQRIENLGLPGWDVWAGELPSAMEVVDSGARLTVLDLSGFGTPQEPLAVSLDLVEGLWARRERRTPTLIVVDEAHNLLPAEPVSRLQVALVERLVQIAAEGRKYGLWLLLSTQRPSKIHPQVLSQCDNLVLMRMNSPADIAELGQVFGFAPTAMLRASTSFVQGEALVAGGFAPVPSVIRMGRRLTVEGGHDVPVPLAGG